VERLNQNSAAWSRPSGPGRRGTGLRPKDDGVGLTARRRWISTVQRKRRSANRKNSRSRTYTNADPQIGKILAPGPIPPAAGEETGLRSRTMGMVDPPSDVMDLRSANLDSKNYRCRTYPPRWPARKRDCDQRRWGYRVNKTDHRKIIAAGPIPPAGRRGNVTAIKDDGGIELTRPIIEKLSLQDLYPPGRRGIVPSQKRRWGGRPTWWSTAAKKYRSRSYLHPEERQDQHAGFRAAGRISVDRDARRDRADRRPA
jgi:hypothetical protein